MNGNDIIEAMEQLDDELILDARSPLTKTKPVTWYRVLAASIAVVLIGVLIFIGAGIHKKAENGNESGEHISGQNEPDNKKHMTANEANGNIQSNNGSNPDVNPLPNYESADNSDIDKPTGNMDIDKPAGNTDISDKQPGNNINDPATADSTQPTTTDTLKQKDSTQKLLSEVEARSSKYSKFISTELWYHYDYSMGILTNEGKPDENFYAVFSDQNREIRIRISRTEAVTDYDARCVADSETKRYDICNYETPFAVSIPEELRSSMMNPIFSYEEMNESIINYRTVKSSENNDSHISLNLAVEQSGFVVDYSIREQSSENAARLLACFQNNADTVQYETAAGDRLYRASDYYDMKSKSDLIVRVCVLPGKENVLQSFTSGSNVLIGTGGYTLTQLEILETYAGSTDTDLITVMEETCTIYQPEGDIIRLPEPYLPLKEGGEYILFLIKEGNSENFELKGTYGIFDMERGKYPVCDDINAMQDADDYELFIPDNYSKEYRETIVNQYAEWYRNVYEDLMLN